MAEPDHIFVNPLPNLAYGGNPAAFPFFYIKPTDNEKIMRKYYPEEKGPVSNIDPIGNSPVIIKKVEPRLCNDYYCKAYLQFCSSTIRFWTLKT